MHAPRLLAAFAAAFAVTASLSAQLAYEPFDYTTGSVAGSGNALGFSGSWSTLGGGDFTVESGNLASLGNTGAGTNHLASINDYKVARYDLASTYGATGTTLTISFTMDSVFEAGSNRFAGLFTPGGIYVGQSSDEFVLAPDGGSGISTGVNVAGLRFLEINFVFLDGNDSITLNVYDGDTRSLLGSANRTDLNVSVGAIGLVAERNSGGGPGQEAIYRFDEITLSNSPIPEPSTFAALAGLGALGFAASRRRARA